MTTTDATQRFREAPDRHVDVGGGVAAAVRTFGSGPDVVLVHGWPVTGATWRRLVPHLLDDLTCHVVDLPGTGASRFDRSARLDVAGHVRAVRAVVDDLGSGEVALVGHDSGGLVSRLAADGDDRVRALGLVATEPPGVPTWLFRAFVAAGRVPGFEHALARLSGSPRLRRLPLVLGGAFDDDDLLGGTFDELELAPLRDDPELRWACGQLVRRFDLALLDGLADVHARLDVPVQLVWGADDPYFPVERARAMVAGFPDAALHVVERARLFVHEERPEEVAAALRGVLVGAG